MIHTKKLPRRLKEIKERMQVLSRPRLSGSKRTTFRGAERRCKSE